MCLDLTVEEMVKEIGHDGSEKVFNLPEPMCRRGHHIQECISVARRMWFSVTPVEFVPCSQSGSERFVLPVNPDFELAINGRGVLTGRTLTCGHAVAFEHGIIFDPDGYRYKYEGEIHAKYGFYPQCAWVIE